MPEPDQSQGREKNDAIPESEAMKRVGKSDQVAGEHASFNRNIPGPNDLEGPAGDPAEGKR